MTMNKNSYEYLKKRMDKNSIYISEFTLSGWKEIIIELTNKLEKIDPDFKIHQIKEKFGGLRVYVEIKKSTDAYELINIAEQKSLSTCMLCGEKGSRRKTSSGWIATFCDEHFNESEIKYKEEQSFYKSLEEDAQHSITVDEIINELDEDNEK